MGQLLFKKALPHIIAIITFLGLNMAYFYPQLSGEVVPQGDVISAQGMFNEIKEYNEKTGDNTLWTNSMFGGMPAYQISSPQEGNKLKYIESISQLFFSRPIGYFNTLMIGSYLLFVFLGVNPWLSLVGAVAFGFSSNNFILYEAGHTNKLRTIALFAPVILGTILTFRKKYLIGGLAFALGMGLNIYAAHPQMTYYLGLVLGVYVLIEIIHGLKNSEVKHLLTSGGIFLAGLALSLGASASKLLTTYEYSKDTMRGAPILEKAANAQAASSSEVEGLEWGYAMQWSNGFMDLVATIIPGAVGGGSSEKVGANTATGKFLRSRGAQAGRAPLYWGSLPFTSGPAYFGAIMCFLFFLGLVLVKGPVKWGIGIGVLLTLLLSLGKNLEGLNHFIFDYLPFYSKFRAPSSILSVTALLVPLLGILGLSEILQGKVTKAEAMKGLKIAGGIGAAITLFFAIIGPGMFDFSSAGDATYQQRGFDVTTFLADRKSLMRSDAFRSFALMAISAGLIWAYLQDKLKSVFVIAGIGVLTLFDLWSVGQRYVGAEDFVSKQQYESNHAPRPVDQQIFGQEPNGRGFYRVLDLSINTFNSSSTSYYHNTVGGYHAAKLQRYQDLIDAHISKNNQQVLNMLNTKYFITQQQQVQSNPGALGTAWFVNSVQKVNTPNDEIAALTNLNPANTAVVLDTEFDNYVGSLTPQKNGTIALATYQPNHLTYNTSSSSEQLAVFSEIWYGPDKGWQAYIDGTPADHVRANYVLRAMKVPAGQHKIEFKFEPKTFQTGETISLVFSMLMILMLLGLLGYKGKAFAENADTLIAAEAKAVKKAAPTVTKTVSKRKKSGKKRK